MCSDFLYHLRSHRYHFVKFVLCLCLFLCVKKIEGPADCEIRSVIRFLKARNVLPSEIHHQICQVYGDNAWVMAWLGNGSGCSMKDERTCTMRHFLLHDNAWPHSAAQTQDLITSFNHLATDYFFEILAHSVFKMWVIQKPNKVALWNKRHFEETKMEIIQHV